MGLAPYGKRRAGKGENTGERFFMTGNLFDGSLSIREGKKKGFKHIARAFQDSLPSELLQHFEDLAYHVQNDLEDVVSTFITDLKELTGEQNLAFAGGVALNSTVNGILDSRRDFKNVYVPPYPGDEGISIGCAAFGFAQLTRNTGSFPTVACTKLKVPVPPYFGRVYGEHDVLKALQSFEPWIVWNSADEARETAQALARSKVVAWFHGRSEFGPRALGNRSLLADPRPRSMINHLNVVVKKREAFRPFAPSILSEFVEEWFSECDANASPFMSITKMARHPSAVRAVVHVDGTSRLQTVRKDQNTRYHTMISCFHDLSGIPMVLNTSFNVAGEPIVESPFDALRTFLDTDGVELLAFPGIVVRKRVETEFATTDVISSSLLSFLSHQVQDSTGSCLKTMITFTPRSFGAADETREVPDQDNEISVELIDSLELEILELVHSEDECLVADLCKTLVAPDCSEHDGGASQMPTVEDVKYRLLDLYQKRLILPSRHQSLHPN